MIRDHFSNLLTFNGRESRAEFWPWAAVVLAIGFFGMALVSLPTVLEAVARMHQFALENPEVSEIRTGPESYEIRIEGGHPELLPDFQPMMVGLGIVLLLMVALLAAAVTRRLHDAGRGAWWGLMPLPFIVIALLVMPGMLADPEQAIGLFALLVVNNFVYLVTLALLIVLLSLPSKAANPAHDPESLAHESGHF